MTVCGSKLPEAHNLLTVCLFLHCMRLVSLTNKNTETKIPWLVSGSSKGLNLCISMAMRKGGRRCWGKVRSGFRHSWGECTKILSSKSYNILWFPKQQKLQKVCQQRLQLWMVSHIYCMVPFQLLLQRIDGNACILLLLCSFSKFHVI